MVRVLFFTNLLGWNLFELQYRSESSLSLTALPVFCPFSVFSSFALFCPIFSAVLRFLRNRLMFCTLFEDDGQPKEKFVSFYNLSICHLHLAENYCKILFFGYLQRSCIKCEKQCGLHLYIYPSCVCVSGHLLTLSRRFIILTTTPYFSLPIRPPSFPHCSSILLLTPHSSHNTISIYQVTPLHLYDITHLPQPK